METFRERWKRSKGKTWDQKSQSDVEKNTERHTNTWERVLPD